MYFINYKVGIIDCLFTLDSATSKLVGTILWTNDAGNHWEFKDIGNPCCNMNATLVDPYVAFGIGQYGVGKKTTDSGATWSSFNYYPLYSGEKLFAFNPDTVYFAGLDNFHLLGAFGKTLDGGSNWNINTISTNKGFTAIYFCNYNKGWVGGDMGVIKYTVNGGNSWIGTGSQLVTLSNIQDIAFTDTLNGWAITSDGKIIHSTDGGIAWSINYKGTDALFAMCFTKPDGIGYAVGDSGRVLKYEQLSATQKINYEIVYSLYPNPNNGKFTLEVNTDSYRDDNVKVKNIEVFNVLGESVLKQTLRSAQPARTGTGGGDNLIDLTNQPNGVYFYRVLSEIGSLIGEGKVVVQR